MKIILLLAVVPAWAGRLALRRKWFKQHHLGGPRSLANNKSFHQYAALMRQKKLQNVRRRQNYPTITDITDKGYVMY